MEITGLAGEFVDEDGVTHIIYLHSDRCFYIFCNVDVSKGFYDLSKSLQFSDAYCTLEGATEALFKFIPDCKRVEVGCVMNNNNIKRNAEGYSDPTVYAAITSDDEKEKFDKFLSLLFGLCDLAGYHLEERVVVKDKRTGKIWR